MSKNVASDGHAVDSVYNVNKRTVKQLHFASASQWQPFYCMVTILQGVMGDEFV